MPAYLCQLGSTPELSLRELTAYIPDTQLELVNNDMALIELASDQDAQSLLGALGGLVKVVAVTSTLPPSPEQTVLTQAVIDILVELDKTETRKLNFAIAELGRDHLESLDLHEIKNALKELGISSRFVESTRHGLSAAVLIHQNVNEVMVVATKKAVYLGHTVAVQNIDEWTHRDRNKPFADRKRGMLTPKVARIMVNLLATKPSETVTPTIYDPFCGTGTVLMEAALLGYHAVGSDLSTEAVLGTQRNLDWLHREYELKTNTQVFASDVSKVTLARLNNQKVDAVVTEPFLGKPKPASTQLPGIFKGLEKLYLGAFKNWTHILKPGGEVVIILPEVVVDQRSYSLESFVDKLVKLGYTSDSGFVRYFRPGAVVQRQIWHFRYQQSE